ncbi:hypothetical protein [Ornithinimicrobium kibberense]|uniref:hypothetical protein n=1 Tax=Ornithinimicrobium kibberense TaxID=282060 RepID=UPI00361B1291
MGRHLPGDRPRPGHRPPRQRPVPGPTGPRGRRPRPPRERALHRGPGALPAAVADGPADVDRRQHRPGAARDHRPRPRRAAVVRAGVSRRVSPARRAAPAARCPCRPSRRCG